MTQRKIPDRFLVAFSFAGEQRDVVRSIAEAVERRLGHGTVFFDEWFLDYIAGTDGNRRLTDIYRALSGLAVPCVSKPYCEKPWTQTEYRAIEELQLNIDNSKEEGDKFRIMPLQVGDGEIPIVPSTQIVPDARKLGVDQSADLIVNRLRHSRPAAGYRVYLADCPPELHDPASPINRQRVKSFLLDRGWFVVPDADPADPASLTTLDAQLRSCLAYIELHGKEPFTPGNRVRTAARNLISKHLRFRSADLETHPDAVRQREEVFGRDVIVSGLDDFLHQLDRELRATLAMWREPAPEVPGDRPPLVRIAIRSSEALEKSHWDHVFHWLFEREQIRLRKLKPGESIVELEKTSPCHGLLVACDSETRSIDELMEQCEEIQIREPNAARQLPIAVVFWPPPDAPPWSRLLNIQPPFRFHHFPAPGDQRDALDRFINDVRRVWELKR